MLRGIRWRGLAVSVAALTIAVAGPGCGASGGDGGSDDAAKDEMKIALLLPDDHAAHYWERAGFERKVEEFCDECELLYGNAQGSVVKQQSQAERVLGEGADVLVLDSVEPDTASRIVGKARSAGVPTISYVRLIPNAGVDYHVGVNDEGLGKLQAELLLMKLKASSSPKGPIVFLTSDSGGPQASSARETIDPAGVKVAEEYDIGGLVPEAAAFASAKREMTRAIAALGPDGFVAVLAPNDEAVAGAIAAMRAKGIDPGEKLTIGAGANLPAVRRVLVGDQYASAYEANWQVRSAAVRAAVRLAKGNGVPHAWVTDELADGSEDVPAILLQPTAVTAANLMSTVIPYRFITPRELCVGRYARYCVEAPRPIR